MGFFFCRAVSPSHILIVALMPHRTRFSCLRAPSLTRRPRRSPCVASHSARDDLEVELQSQLQFPGIVYRLRDCSEIALADGRVWSLELGVIEDVEGFRAKLQTHTFAEFRYGEFLEQGHVYVCGTRLADAGDRSRRIAEGKGRER